MTRQYLEETPDGRIMLVTEHEDGNSEAVEVHDDWSLPVGLLDAYEQLVRDRDADLAYIDACHATARAAYDNSRGRLNR